jgi:hypothetical protein
LATIWPFEIVACGDSAARLEGGLIKKLNPSKMATALPMFGIAGMTGPARKAQILAIALSLQS